MSPSFIFPKLKTSWYHQQKGCRRRLGCLFVAFLLLLLLLCGLLFLALAPAQAAEGEPLSVILIIDNSHSVFTETDPDGLRLSAVRLFLTSLSLHPDAELHQAGLIFFGSRAETAVPLQPLADSSFGTRDHLLSPPSPSTAMGWTNPVAALTLAREQLVSATPNGRSAILLFTDGHPEWSDSPTVAETTAYMDALQATGQQLSQDNITLFTIILQNNQTDDLQPWLPLWRAISEATPSGQLLQIEHPTQLPDLYHTLVTALTGQQTAGLILQAAITNEQAELFTFTVPPNLTQLTLLISKSNPNQHIALYPANTSPQTAISIPGQYISQDNNSLEGGWIIDDPLPGLWQVEVSGEGNIAIWEDYQLLLPIPSPKAAITLAPTAPSPTLTAVPPTPSPQPSAFRTIPSPTLQPTSPPQNNISTFPTQPPAFNTPPAPIAPSAPPNWLWLLVLPILLPIGIYLWKQPTHLPIVTGNLRILAGPGTSTGQHQIELDTLKKSAITIGQSPADIPLLGATARLTLQPSTDHNNLPTIRIWGSTETLLNGSSLTQETTVEDNAQIMIPPNHQLRYENLRLRAAQRTWKANSYH